MNQYFYTYGNINQRYNPINRYYYQPTKAESTAENLSLSGRTVRINRASYNVAQKLGKGGFGAVYAAYKQPNGEPVAVKVISLSRLPPEKAKSYQQSFMTEVTLARKLLQSTRRIIKVYDFDFHAYTGFGFIAMEQGLYDLEKALTMKGRLSSPERKNIWQQLITIGQILYNQGIVHLDLKPANILMFPNNYLKLIDLGIAKRANTIRTSFIGTEGYSAPEVFDESNQYTSENTTKSDAWSWAAIMYRIAYLRSPTYNPPCYRPPPKVKMTSDAKLADMLRRTLVVDPAKRLGIPQLVSHPYSRSH